MRTACNYTVRLSVDGLVAYSQYFTIINEDDGPVPDSATCPIERGVSRPQIDGNSTVLGSEEASSTSESGNTGSSGSSSGGGGGISTSTLAVAIVIPIVVLLVAFALLLWFGIRRGWFVKLAHKRASKGHLRHENTAGFGGGPNIAQQSARYPMSPSTVAAEKRGEVVSPMSPGYGGGQLQELHGEFRAWEAEGRQVHQLEGDERDARFGDGNMRRS